MDNIKSSISEYQSELISNPHKGIRCRRFAKKYYIRKGLVHLLQIQAYLKDAFSKVQSPRLVILAPIKCETYTRTARDAESFLYHLKIAYSELLDFLKSDSLINNVAVVVTPVQTIGNVIFSHYKTDENNFTKFYYHKTPINAPYEPKDGEQPLRYILLFLINVYLENKKNLLV